MKVEQKVLIIQVAFKKRRDLDLTSFLLLFRFISYYRFVTAKINNRRSNRFSMFIANNFSFPCFIHISYSRIGYTKINTNNVFHYIISNTLLQSEDEGTKVRKHPYNRR